jgi:hypothetical protein
MRRHWIVMSLSISKGWLAALLASTVLCTLVLLKPEPAATAVAAEIVEAAETSATVAEGGAAMPWTREAKSVALIKKNIATTKPIVPPLPAPPVAVPLVVTRPVAPAPMFTYLGKMTRDGKVHVFLGKGEEVMVVAVGDSLDDTWRLESANGSDIELRYLPLNELKKLAMVGNR